MTLVRNTYGKGRVRVMRVNRDTERHKVSELSVGAMLEGDFARAYTEGDNSPVVATDTIKNIVNIVARENLGLATEPFCEAVGRRLIERYPQAARATITGLETKWVRLQVGGRPHEHSFVLDNNGKPYARVVTTRSGAAIESGIQGFTFMKTTASGWENYVMDAYTTLPPTADRICATSMDAKWSWSAEPGNYAAANARILSVMLDEFAMTYSKGVQDSLYRMGEAALKAVPEISEVSIAAPNKHYLLINLRPFDLDNNNQVFLPTDEPHGQIECMVARG
jgi:urate oxidase